MDGNLSSEVFRFQAVQMRERFDKHAKEKDMRKAVELLKAGQEELFMKQHPIPKRCEFLFDKMNEKCVMLMKVKQRDRFDHLDLE